MVFGSIAALFIAGGIFFAGGTQACKKTPYPYRWVDIGFQLTVGSVALLAGALWALAIIVAPFRMAHP